MPSKSNQPAPSTLKYFFSNLGRLPQTSLNIILMLIAGLGEGIGLIMFVPVIQMMQGNLETTLPVYRYLSSIFTFFGIEASMLNMLIVISLVMISALLLTYFQLVFLNRSKIVFLAQIRETLLSSLLNSQWLYLSRKATGDVINRMLLESLRCAETLGFQVSILVTAAQSLLLFVISAFLSWQLALATTFFIVFIILCLYPLQRLASRHGENISRTNHAYGFHVLEYLRAARLIKITGLEDEAISQSGRYSQAQCDAMLANRNNSALINFIVNAMPVIFIVAVIFSSQTLFSLNTSITLVFLLIVARIGPKLSQLQQYLQGYNAQGSALKMADDLINEARAFQEHQTGSGHKTTNFNQHIIFNNVTFSYNPDEPAVLPDLSLTIDCRKTTALVGRSGAGKSTLVDLIAGLQRPAKGQILVDDVDLNTVDLLYWRKKIGYVSQDTSLFNDTVRNNLLFINPRASVDDINRVLKIANMTEVINELPQGLDTVLGESGIRLSGGQKQRLALARALIGNPEILILDEATSALDNESERLVQEALETLSHTLTIIVIAHRLSTVRNADLIIMLDKGKIVERGTYRKLINSDGLFAKLNNDLLPVSESDSRPHPKQANKT